MSDSLIPSFFGERCERIAQVRSPKMSDHERFAHVVQRKWAIRSELLRLLTKNERMSELLVFLANCSFVHFWANQSDSLRKPRSKFPALKEIDPPLCTCNVLYIIFFLMLNVYQFINSALVCKNIIFCTSNTYFYYFCIKKTFSYTEI